MRTLLLALLVSGPAWAAPLELSHSGRLLDGAGDPVQGDQAVTFSLYDVATGGSPVWTETMSVPFDDGYFAVTLGAGSTALEDDDFTTWPLFLGVRVGGGTELTPRQRVVSAPFAVQARTSTNVKGGTVDATAVMVSGDLVVDGDVVVGGSTVIDASGNVTASTVEAGSVSINGTTVLDGDGDLHVGAIDADSLSIGGTTVIDGSGNFTGTVGAAALDGLGCAADTYPVRRGSGWACEAVVVPPSTSAIRAAVTGAPIGLAAGSTVGGEAFVTDWSDLSPPADLANGDLLESLSCAAGTYPARGAQGWTCLAQVLDTDTLEGLQCAEGDVIQRGPVDWECVSALSLTSLDAAEMSGDHLDLTGAVFLGTEDDAWCAAGREGALIFDTTNNYLQVCTENGWLAIGVQRIVNVGGSRRWSDGTFATSCDGYRHPPAPLEYAGEVGDGNYTIDPDGPGGNAAFATYCQMTLAGGGWSLALNLDTSDGHVMWWGEAGWTDTNPYGTVTDVLETDVKTPAYWELGGATQVLLVVHEEGAVRGWKQFAKSGTGVLRSYLLGGDNTVLGSSVIASDTALLWSGERLVRASTALYANHCVTTGGSCTSGSAGSPDGDRIGSHEAVPSDNNGGGLGNWHDMNHCCSGTLAGHTCNGQGIRTCAEAQAAWSSTGILGTDTCQPATGAANQSCSAASWSSYSPYAYDYAIYLR